MTRAALAILLASACAHAGKPGDVPMPPPPAPKAPTDAGVRSAELPPAPGAAESRRLDFKNGAPVIPVRLMEGNAAVSFASKGRLRFRVSALVEGQRVEKVVEGPAGTEWQVRLVKGTPAELVARIQIAEVAFNDKVGLASAQQEWADRGLSTKSQVLGALYGIAGKVIDTRRYVLVVDQPPAPPASLAAQQADILTKHQVRTSLLEEVKTAQRAVIELLDGAGGVIATAQDKLVADSLDAAPIEVRRVEFGVGYDFHNFEDRSYRGAIQFSADRSGRLAVINQIGMEELLKGLVPSEIFAKAHLEALKAQAVTARAEVLAKVGLKHVADPYFLCTEQHCAVYRGVSGEAASTNAAVDATRGEMLFDLEGRLVDAVYSAVCGGHTEHNEIVWGGVANQALRGRPDVLPGKPATPAPSKDLKAFLSTEGASACRLSTFAAPTKFRWEKRFTSKEVDDKLAPFKVGRVMAMTVSERGVSGRARLLQVSGEDGATTIRGELVIRRLFSNLNSAMFEVKAERDPKGRPTGWAFTGGGWGHGVGMCQTGAIGRAEAGQTYQQILEHYFGGATVSRVY
ncbi:MAG: SpoIID/LytB domain-containing protein [Myxococcales bacterium]|nr:SpoIID/LytB domain-containing protein [Myxococcales bacterium]